VEVTLKRRRLSPSTVSPSGMCASQSGLCMTTADQPLSFVLDLIRLIQGRNWQLPACQCLWCYITRHRRHGRCTSRQRTYCTRPQPPSSGHCVPSCSCHGLRWQLLNSRATRYATLAAMIDSCDTCLACARMSAVLGYRATANSRGLVLCSGSGGFDSGGASGGCRGGLQMSRAL